MLELGADPNVIFDDGGTVMHWAARNDDIFFLRVALVYGGNPNLIAGQFEQAPLFEAISIFGNIGDTSFLQLLLENKSNIDTRRSNGDTPLIFAAKLNRFDMVYELLINEADASIKNNFGYDLSSIILDKKDSIDKGHELFSWLEKVESLLGE